jgi:hypothetical protein
MHPTAAADPSTTTTTIERKRANTIEPPGTAII